MAKKMNFTRRNRAKRTIENVGFMQIKDAAAGGVELYIYGDIVSSEWDKWTPEDTCPQDITDFLNGIDNNAELTVYINSCGGDVFAGIGIYNILKRHKGHITGIVDGIAASIASVILMACDDIVVSTGAQIMIHKPLTMAWGNADDFTAVEVDADSTPWDDVDEGEEFGEEETPKLKQIKYKIKKKGGILKVTRELLQDTAENILGFLNKWIAKKSRATRNAAILKKLAEITTGKEVAISGYDDLKDVFNVTLDPAIASSSIVLTNQSGFNYLDKIKDERGDYILQHDVTDKSKMLLFGVYPIKKVSNKVLKNVEVKSDGSNVSAYKYPIYMGDLKEAITLFDREKISIELSTEAGDLWAKDQTGIKVRDRFDVQAFDEEAVIKGEITVQVAG